MPSPNIRNTITLYPSDELKERLRAFAASQNRSMANAGLRLLEAALDAESSQNTPNLNRNLVG